MPHLPRRETGIYRAVHERAKGRKSLQSHEAKGIVESRRREFIGSGAHQVVVSDPEHPDQVIAFPFHEMEPQQAKELYYIQKLLSNLFPNNFSAIRAGIESGPDQKFISATIRDRVKDGESLANYGSFLRDAEKALSEVREIQHPFTEVLEEIKALKLPITIDITADNFVITPEGDVMSLDTPTYTTQMKWDIDAITDFLQEKQVDPVRQRRVLSAIDRLANLGVVKISDQELQFIRRQLQRD